MRNSGRASPKLPSERSGSIGQEGGASSRESRPPERETHAWFPPTCRSRPALERIVAPPEKSVRNGTPEESLKSGLSSRHAPGRCDVDHCACACSRRNSAHRPLLWPGLLSSGPQNLRGAEALERHDLR